MHEDGSLNLSQVPPLVDHMLRCGLSGLYVLGSTGEGVSLTSEERRQTAEAFVTAAEGRLKIAIQVGHNSLREARALAAHAQQIGADAVSAVAPSYFNITSLEILAECMAEVAAGAPELPFYYYHIPAMTGLTVDMARFLPLAAERIENLAGAKFTAPQIDVLQACVQLDDGRFDMLFGMDEMLLAGLTVGACGAVGTTYSFAAPLYHRIIEAFASGDLATARRWQATAVQMIRTVQAFPNHVFKSVMKMVGVDCGPVRLPLVSLADADQQRLRGELESIGFFNWALAAEGPRQSTWPE
jgi:N-acetylneuraminate lyase